MVEADTNGDGRIDFEDEFVIRVVSSAGGVGTTVGQGRSAVWSPDGKYIAFVTQGQVKLTTPAGGMVPQGSATPPGRLILASGRSPDTAHDFWALDSQKSAAEKEELPDDLRKKYLWLGAMSPSGSEVVFVNTTRTSLLLMETANPTSSRVLLHADFHLMDPAWSPDGRRFVYVSESASNKPFCD
jgi:dipeptidyl aminopeptidase/acylaminoacyl peptidase